MTSSFLSTVDRFPDPNNNTSIDREEVSLPKQTKKSTTLQKKPLIRRPRFFSNQSFIPRNPDNYYLPYDADDIISCCNIERIDSCKGNVPFTSVGRRDRAFADGLIWRTKFRPGDGDQVGPADYKVCQWPDIPFKPTGYTEKSKIINARTRRGDNYWERKGMLAKTGILVKEQYLSKRKFHSPETKLRTESLVVVKENLNKSSKPETI